MSDREHDVGGSAGSCEPLIALAAPGLYASNPFRVLGARVDSSIKDVKRDQQRRTMQEQLGLADTSSEPAHVFPRSVDPDAQRAALEALARPVDRLIAELFWFWPTGPDDQALEALERGEAARAAEVWSADPSSALARHNLAVLYHARSLEQSADEGVQEEAFAGGWGRALQAWSVVHEDEDFWATYRDRAIAMNDTLLTTGLVRQIRSTLPTALLTVHGKIAYAAAISGDLTTARKHVALVRGSTFAPRLADEAIREALDPVRNRIRGAIDTAQNSWTAAPQHGGRYVRDLHRLSTELLEVVDQLLAADDPTKLALHDDVGEAMLRGQVAYGAATNDWKGSADLLRLALEIASGGPVRSKLEENLGVVEELADDANNWCAPGYWEQPDDVVRQLEAAREKAKAGDYDGAIRDLLAMDPEIGAPLYRALSNALSQQGIRTWNNGLSEFESERDVIRAIMNRLRSMSELERAMALTNRPEPSKPSWSNPPCLSCGRGAYSSWVNFTHNDISLFMCADCNKKDDRQIESRKTALQEALRIALEHVRLADELDPGDSGIERNLESLEASAKNHGWSVPTTKKLRRRLRGDLLRAVRFVPDNAEPGRCHFCGEAPGDPPNSITVPMYGNVRSESFILGEGRAFDYEDIVVPRCSRCAAAHAAAVHGREEWELAHTFAAADGETEELLAAIREAAEASTAAEAEVERARSELERARAASVSVTTLPTSCDRCEGDAEWDDGLCRRCDAELYGVGGRQALLAAGLGAVAMGNLVFGAGTGIVRGVAEGYAMSAGLFLPVATTRVTIALTLLVGVVVAGLMWALSVRHGIERTEVRHSREKAFEERQAEAAELARGTEVECEVALEAAEAGAVEPARTLADAEARLEEARVEAQRVYAAANPRPPLAPGVAEESIYLEFERIDLRLAEGWGFGTDPHDEGAQVRSEPYGVLGLVA